MKPYIYSIQFVSEKDDFNMIFDRGIMFANSFSEVIKELEKERISHNDSIIDLYITAMEKSIIHINEETYDKLINGENI